MRIHHLPHFFLWVALATSTTLVTACSPSINHHGYIARPGAFGQIQEGMTKVEIERILGSPSTTASVNFQGDSFYYISSTTESRAFLNDKEVGREVIAVRFDKSDRVTSYARYGLEDGRIINMNERSTPVPGADLSVLQDIFGSLLGSKPTF